ncbi:SMI1/KNR4 family protein [Lentzea sp. CC55]|uniref:SMI1/KNR4 family protein n=1 Tax=Lentzea sp. CC55 TaxID=2884909 RepID=UPI001F1939F0|nr:SMI1/KNR4 family protein [Lentzea sp. CC55]MCG8923887.1 SMI1/KNR4 family protein [Lentzea sp. CC55]
MEFSGKPVPVDWDAAESWLGLPLPGDYKAIASAHGPLDIGEFVWLHVPCVEAGRFDWGEWVKQTRSVADAPPHLVPWGATRGGGYLFWDSSVDADPARWPVVGFGHDTGWHDYGTSLSGLLEEAVRTALPGLGLLPASARRTAFLPDARPWTPPSPVDSSPGRRRALAGGTGLATLRELVVPPAHPVLGERTWEWLYGELGTSLPADYVALMETYGSGTFAGWLRVWAPLDRTACWTCPRARSTATGSCGRSSPSTTRCRCGRSPAGSCRSATRSTATSSGGSRGASRTDGR